MAKEEEKEVIAPHLMEWMKKQHVFFVATAPLQPDGHVNLSPKGYKTLAFLAHNQVRRPAPSSSYNDNDDDEEELQH